MKALTKNSGYAYGCSLCHTHEWESCHTAYFGWYVISWCVVFE